MIGIEKVLCATAFRIELHDGHLRFELVPGSWARAACSSEVPIDSRDQLSS
jgi:hypothetical protein